jgi:hypothetical protein
MKKSLFLLLFNFTAVCSFAQIVLQVQLCSSANQAITITNLGLSLSSDSWSTPNLAFSGNSVSGQAVYVNDGVGDVNDGCEAIVNTSQLAGKIAFINRGSCGFGYKALQAQNAGAIGVVIVQNTNLDPFDMGGGNEGLSVTIPVIMVRIENGQLVNQHPSCNFFIGTLPQANYDLNLVSGFLGLNTRPYHKIPASQVNSNGYNFYGTVANNGALDQQNVRILVSSNSTQIESSPNNNLNLTTGEENTLSTNPYLLQNSAGSSYIFNYEAVSNETEERPFNNFASTKVEITNHILAKDNLLDPMTQQIVYYGFPAYIPGVQTDGIQTLFDIPNQDRLFAVDLLLDVTNNNIGSKINVVIHHIGFGEVGYGTYTLTQNDVTTQANYGNLISIPIGTSGIELIPGEYAIIVSCDASQASVQNSSPLLGARGYSYGSSASFSAGGVYFPWNPFINYYANTPIIRMNFDCTAFQNPNNNFALESISTAKSCWSACNGSAVVGYSSADQLKIYNQNSVLLQTVNVSGSDNSNVIDNLCAGNYIVVGKNSCYNVNSASLPITIEEEYEVVSINSINSSNCLSEDASFELQLKASDPLNPLSNHDLTFQWNGLTTGNENIIGDNNTSLTYISSNNTSSTVSIIKGGNLKANSSQPGSSYTLVITDNLRNCTSPAFNFVINSDTPIQPTCLVTVDDVTGNSNIVVWEKPEDISYIDSFKIYREITTGNYGLLHTQSVNELSKFEDLEANPNATGYKYKIAALDVCGQESELSDFHNTIHLQYLGSGNFQWSQYGIENTANPVASYNVYRDNDGTGNFQLVPNGVVSGSQSTYTDVVFNNYPNARYYVDVNWNDQTSCNVTKSFVTSRSNVKGLGENTTGAMEFHLSQLNVYPNPTSENCNIQVPSSLLGQEVILKNSIGQVLKTFKLEIEVTNIDLSDYSIGIYFVEINSALGYLAKKIVKK